MTTAGSKTAAGGTSVTLEVTVPGGDRETHRAPAMLLPAPGNEKVVQEKATGTAALKLLKCTKVRGCERRVRAAPSLVASNGRWCPARLCPHLCTSLTASGAPS